MEELQARLHEVFNTEIRGSACISLPQWAFDPLRSQYDAGTLLQTLPEGKAQGRILGIADQDLYVPRLNFVFGVADPQGRRALIAFSRLREDFYGRPPNPGLFLLRATKEAVHELGHTGGLEHCPDPDCVMYFSNTLGDTDNKGYQFCSRCEALITF
jgi:archaemetzincin